MIRRACAVFLATLLIAPIAARSEEGAQPRPIERKCAVPSDNTWTPQEKFVWGRVCIGEEANFNEAQGYGGNLDPRKPEGLPENRVLRSSFLETILLQDRYRRALTRRGVRIVGARFKETIDLEKAELRNGLWLDTSLLEGGANFCGLKSTQEISIDGSKVSASLCMNGLQVDDNVSMSEGAEFEEIDLTSAHVGGQLDLSGSTVAGTLEMNGLRVDQSLFMSEGAEFKKVDLTDARVGLDLDMSGSTVTGMLEMNGLQVDQNLFMRGAKFEGVDLTGAHVVRTVDLSSSTVTGTLNMNALRVDEALFMNMGASFAEVNLGTAHVVGAVDLTSSKVSGKLDMSGLQVDRYLLMSEGASFADVNLVFTHVGGELVLNNSKVAGELNCSEVEVGSDFLIGVDAVFVGPIRCQFAKVGTLSLVGGSFYKGVDFTGAQIAREIRLGLSGYKPAQWADNSSLTLRNVMVDAIQDFGNVWPAKLDLNGLTYRSLGGMAERPVKWFEDWLRKQDHYAPQPYEQLALALRNYGRSRAADDILFAGKERDRADAFRRWQQDNGLLDLFSWLWLTAHDLFIGYGYHIERSIFWVLGFWAAGIGVMAISGEGRRNGMPFGIAYSFDLLLPIIRLREKHYQIDLNGWPRYYFYLHRIMGFVLASFLIAGLSGLTR